MNYNQGTGPQMKNGSVPVLITWDVDPDLWIPLENRKQALRAAMNLCHDLGIRATFFVTAQPAHLLADELETMQVQGHEAGCHGLTHGNEEDYDRMPEEMQQAYIEEATETLQEVVGQPILAFRSPRVKTSARTLGILTQYGYRSDSSVCSQRVDFISSNLINPGWLFSPRRPYRPHRDSAFKAGDMPIWEIPVSAIAMPFISSLLRVVGPPAMKMFFKTLYAESRLTGKPIVYLAHPTEFLGGSSEKKAGQRYTSYIRREYFSPSFIRTHGLRMRNSFYRFNGQELLAGSRELFAYMASFSDVKFMTVTEYVQHNLMGVEYQRG